MPESRTANKFLEMIGKGQLSVSAAGELSRSFVTWCILIVFYFATLGILIQPFHKGPSAKVQTRVAPTGRIQQHLLSFVATMFWDGQANQIKGSFQKDHPPKRITQNLLSFDTATRITHQKGLAHGTKLFQKTLQKTHDYINGFPPIPRLQIMKVHCSMKLLVVLPHSELKVHMRVTKRGTC